MTDKWSMFHSDKVKKNYPSWPVEAMVKVLFGDYLEQKPALTQDMRVLDIGCGFGNNLLPFYMKGLKCHGIELSEEIIGVTGKALEEKGIRDIVLKVGHNRSIPFEDNYFDLIVSNNVLHYESTEENILAAFKEYKRVLKPGGHMFFMTVAPEHDIYKRAKTLGNHVYEIQNYDFRNGEKYFYFDNLKYLESYLSRFFTHVELGQVTEKLMKVSLDFFLAVARK